MPNVENIIINNNELDITAIELLNFLIDNGMYFERAGGYWKNQSYWYVKYNNEFVCYILFNGTGDEEKFSPLTIWTDDSGTTFRFINPNWDELKCLKELLLLRKKDIEEN